MYFSTCATRNVYGRGDVHDNIITNENFLCGQAQLYHIEEEEYSFDERRSFRLEV